MNELANIAQNEAMRFFHGYVSNTESNLDEIIRPFPGWTKAEADGLWCAAFVYHCCKKTGYSIPIRPAECITCNLAGCVAWEEWAMADKRIEYYGRNSNFSPLKGDIVLFDRVFENSEHDHMGIIIEVKSNTIIVAEGNFNNVSCIVNRKIDEHIRAYIRIPKSFTY